MDDVAHVNVEQVAKFWAGERVVQEEADVRGFSEVQVYEKERGKQEGRGRSSFSFFSIILFVVPGFDGFG